VAAFFMLKLLLLVTALVESGAGIALLVALSWVTKLLLGEGPTSPQSLVLGQIMGAALVSIGVACWLASDREPSGQRGMVGSLLIYNLAVPALLIHATVAYGTHGIALWPAGILHTTLAIWCVLCLQSR
jgi:hypothetical protein